MMPKTGGAVHVQPGDKLWERVGERTTRMRIDGGWLYKIESYSGQVSVQFVPASAAAEDYQNRNLLKEG